jgi:hypothetical protein|tara:strand:+ start:10300 stop:10527 length:228 start_codon:yes stop_codon:yes gene_type:complete
MREIFIGVSTLGVFGVLSWITLTLVTVDKRTEVMSVKIDHNNMMLKPLWEDFIRRSAKNGNGEVTNGKASLEIWK